MRQRVYVWSEEQKRLVPAWADKGPGYARAAGIRGEMLVGVSEKSMQRIRDQRKRDAAA